MAEGTYEFECMRAELLGLEKPDKEKFELELAERIKAEQERVETEQANELDHHDEALGRTGGKLDELNSILSTTQQRLSRFKKTACGSLSNIFSRPSVDEPSTSKDRSDGNHRKQSGNINDALDTLDKMEDVKLQSDVKVAKNASLDIQKKMTSHIDKLDSLVNKAEQAEMSMTEQTKDMKRFIRK